MKIQAKDPSVLEEIGAAFAIAGMLFLSWLLRPWYSHWGIPHEEAKRPLPGDEIVPEPTLEVTRGVTIQARAEDIWSWLAQIGQEKGGLYTYQHLENLAGCRIHNAQQIEPQWQNPQPGDNVRLGPKGYPLFRITAIEPNRALIMQACDPVKEDPGPATWIFLIEPLAGGNCRLWTRSRNHFERTFGNLLMWRVIVEPIHFVMERRMLIGIKQRAEATRLA